MGQGQSAFQGAGSIDVGAARLEQPAQSPVTAPTLSGEYRLDGRRLAVRAAGGGTIGGGNRWAAQGDLGASWMVPTTARTAFELGAAASALRYRGEPGAASGMLLARHHVELGRVGTWTGLGGGVLGRQLGRTGPAVSAEAGTWLRGERLRASLSLAAQRARLDTIDRSVPGITEPTRFPAFVTLDATGQAEWRTPRVELTGTATVRRAQRQSSDLLRFVYVAGAVRLVPRLALTASAGDLDADPLRGFPARRIGSLGLRWSLGTRQTPRPSAPAVYPAADVVARGGRRVLRVRTAGPAATVEVRGDFTNWQVVALARAGDAWELPLAAEPGTLRVALRVDGGTWAAPANLPSVEDDFGERSGLLVVP